MRTVRSCVLVFGLSLLGGCGGAAADAGADSNRGGDTAGGDPTDGPSSTGETDLHAFVAAMCSEAARAMQDTTRPIEARMEALAQWGRGPGRERMIAQLGEQLEALSSGTELERARVVLSEVAPDVDCSALFRLRELADATETN